MSLDHYYTASVLGKGFGKIAKDKHGNVLGGRYWNVPVLNLNNLE